MPHKLNSILSLLLSLVYSIHLFIMGSLMLGIMHFYPGFSLMSNGLMILFILHAILISFLLLTNQLGVKTKKYAQINYDVYLQRISALVLTILLHFHLSGFAEHQLVSVSAFVLQLLLVLAGAIHMALSIPKALLGLGIVVTKDAFQRTKTVSAILSAAVSLYAIVGFCVLAFHSGIF